MSGPLELFNLASPWEGGVVNSPILCIWPKLCELALLMVSMLVSCGCITGGSLSPLIWALLMLHLPFSRLIIPEVPNGFHHVQPH